MHVPYATHFRLGRDNKVLVVGIRSKAEQYKLS